MTKGTERSLTHFSHTRSLIRTSCVLKFCFSACGLIITVHSQARKISKYRDVCSIESRRREPLLLRLQPHDAAITTSWTMEIAHRPRISGFHQRPEARDVRCRASYYGCRRRPRQSHGSRRGRNHKSIPSLLSSNFK